MPKKLFVASLSSTVRKHEIVTLFSKFGKVKRVELVSQKNSSRCKGFAFVTFLEDSDAYKVLSQEVYMKGRRLTIREQLKGKKLSKFREEFRQRRMFVGDLPKTACDNDLFTVFSQIGTVETAYVIKSHSTGENSCFGYVLFKNTQTLEVALKSLIKIKGKVVRCERFKHKKLDEEQKNQKVKADEVELQVSKIKKNDPYKNNGNRNQNDGLAHNSSKPSAPHKQKEDISFKRHQKRKELSSKSSKFFKNKNYNLQPFNMKEQKNNKNQQLLANISMKQNFAQQKQEYEKQQVQQEVDKIKQNNNNLIHEQQELLKKELSSNSKEFFPSIQNGSSNFNNENSNNSHSSDNMSGIQEHWWHEVTCPNNSTVKNLRVRQLLQQVTPNKKGSRRTSFGSANTQAFKPNIIFGKDEISKSRIVVSPIYYSNQQDFINYHKNQNNHIFSNLRFSKTRSNYMVNNLPMDRRELLQSNNLNRRIDLPLHILQWNETGEEKSPNQTNEIQMTKDINNTTSLLPFSLRIDRLNNRVIQSQDKQIKEIRTFQNSRGEYYKLF